MSLQDYITVDDVNNKLFSRFNDSTKTSYIAIANDELEDLAIRKGVDPSDIVAPIHFKLKQYAVNYAISQLAQDNIGVNTKDGAIGEDVYENLFKRTQYLLQNIKNQVTEVMFTGKVQTPENRAVRSQAIFRG